MVNLKLTLIGIPRSIWKSFPADRSLDAVSIDAEGACRRIKKHVNARHENTRYRQICSYIELIALKLAKKDTQEANKESFSSVRTLTLIDSPDARCVSNYLNVLEQTEDSESSFSFRDVIQRTIFSETKLIKAQCKFLKFVIKLRLSPDGSPTISDLDDPSKVIEDILQFFLKAAESNEAVVQYLSAVPCCLPLVITPRAIG